MAWVEQQGILVPAGSVEATGRAEARVLTAEMVLASVRELRQELESEMVLEQEFVQALEQVVGKAQALAQEMVQQQARK